MRTLGRFQVICDTNIPKICAKQFYTEKKEVARSSLGYRTTIIPI
jgi:hypothetical protein